MSDTRQIKNRHRAVSDIGKLTGTMEMISRARYRKHLESWQNRQDFNDGLAQLAYLVFAGGSEIKHPLMEEATSGKWQFLLWAPIEGFAAVLTAI